MSSILWLRRDLRRSDHPALQEAAAGGPVLPVFVIEPRLWEAAGPVRRGWLAATVLATRDAFDGRLLVRAGRPDTVLTALCGEHAVSAVHYTRETTPWAVRRDDRVAATLHERDIDMVATGTPYAVGPGLVTRDSGQSYKVFTPFSRAWRSHGWPAPAPDPQGLQLIDGADDTDALTTLKQAVQDCPVPLPDAGEDAARARWAEFLHDSIGLYDEDRDRPDLDGTSRLSPHLKVGAIHPRTLLHDLSRRRSRSADRFRTELAWREFYADVLWRAPESAWHDMTSGMSPLYDAPAHARRDADRDSDDNAEELVRAWQEGRTGYPLVDAGMRQLNATGWMHNRVRMVTASFFTKDLHRWWGEGARYFMEHLIDGDLASNNHGWQWVAGTGTDAAPFHRVFNPVRQGERFDPDGDYVRAWVPELRHLNGADVHAPWKHPEGHAHGYPAPVVDHDHERRDALGRYEHVRASKADRGSQR
ncbi:MULTISPECIES: cryptochrome/photolyase family protein [Flexivirga]|uniref:Deoxyribodipyrimidine photo-lyase n=1 Tax=Flexivirga endophytica TaxID=1849103 RepID=A0A916WS05_9MICO|nr:deoxyribodipyrimidine photo-lyase [Flexivirga endophytica]GGB24386.1 deoxyribodipyrimidine photo-lyase [Flexivirga endophytica]GHB63079.1 deoxyribodipyrimidine photo-lyase [Flexivirga endophytica]